MPSSPTLSRQREPRTRKQTERSSTAPRRENDGHVTIRLLDGIIRLSCIQGVRRTDHKTLIAFSVATSRLKSSEVRPVHEDHPDSERRSDVVDRCLATLEQSGIITRIERTDSVRLSHEALDKLVELELWIPNLRQDRLGDFAANMTTRKIAELVLANW